MADTEPTTDRRLDVREIDGEPFGEIMTALDSLEPDQSLLLIAGFEPVPLYEVLDSRGFDHRTTHVADEEYHVAIEPT